MEIREKTDTADGGRGKSYASSLTKRTGTWLSKPSLLEGLQYIRIMSVVNVYVTSVSRECHLEVSFYLDIDCATNTAVMR